MTTIGILLRKVKTLQQVTEKIETEPRPKIVQRLGPRKSSVMKSGLLSPSTRSSRALMEDTKLRKSGPNPFNLVQTLILLKIHMFSLYMTYIICHSPRTLLKAVKPSVPAPASKAKAKAKAASKSSGRKPKPRGDAADDDDDQDEGEAPPRSKRPRRRNS